MREEPAGAERLPGADTGWARETGSGIAWSTAAFVAARLVSFLSLLVLARLIAPDAFGVMAAIITFLGFLELASDLGMRNTVVYEQERGITPRVQTAFALNLGISLALTVVGVAAAPLVARWFKVPDESWLFALASLNLFLTGLGNIHDGLLMRSMDFRMRTWPQLARAALRAIVTIALALAGMGPEALVIGYLAGTVAWVIVLWLSAHELLLPRYDRQVARSMLSYGAGASMLEILAALGNALPPLVIGRMLGSVSLGLYSVAMRIPELFIQSVAWNVSVVAFPALARRRAHDAGAVNDAANGLIRWTALFAAPVAIWMATMSGPLVRVLLGPEWAGAEEVLTALAVGEIFAVLLFPIGDAFKAAGRQRPYVLAQTGALIVLVAAMVLTASEGLAAVAWARTAQMAVFALAVVLVARAVLGYRPSGMLRALAPGAAAASGVFLGAGFVRVVWPADALVPLIAGTGAAIAVGALLLWLLDPASWREARSAVRALLRRARRPAPQAAG